MTDKEGPLEPPDRRRADQSDLTPQQRSERSRKAAHARWDATPYGRTAATQKARDALWEKFLTQADPEGRLDPQERARRATKLQSRHFQELARRRNRKSGAAE